MQNHVFGSIHASLARKIVKGYHCLVMSDDCSIVHWAQAIWLLLTCELLLLPFTAPLSRFAAATGARLASESANGSEKRDQR